MSTPLVTPVTIRGQEICADDGTSLGTVRKVGIPGFRTQVVVDTEGQVLVRLAQRRDWLLRRCWVLRDAGGAELARIDRYGFLPLDLRRYRIHADGTELGTCKQQTINRFVLRGRDGERIATVGRKDKYKPHKERFTIPHNIDAEPVPGLVLAVALGPAMVKAWKPVPATVDT